MGRTLRISSLSVSLALALARPALADGTKTDGTTRDLPRRWYGAETLACDGTAVVAATFFVLLPEDSGDDGRDEDPKAAAGLLAAVAYFAAVPIVHMRHRNLDASIASFVLRVAMPLTGAALASGGGSSAAWGGAAFGALGAAAIDASVLAYADPKRPPIPVWVSKFE